MPVLLGHLHPVLRRIKVAEICHVQAQSQSPCVDLVLKPVDSVDSALQGGDNVSGPAVVRFRSEKNLHEPEEAKAASRHDVAQKYGVCEMLFRIAAFGM